MQTTQRPARLTMKHQRCGRQRSPGQSRHRHYQHTSALAPVRPGLQPCSTSSSSFPPSTTTPTLPPLVCTSYIMEKSVILSLYGMILLLPDCSRFLPRTLHCVSADTLLSSPTLVTRNVLLVGDMEPTFGRVRIGRSLPLEQFLIRVLRSQCVALAFCSACLIKEGASATNSLGACQKVGPKESICVKKT